MIPKIIHYCWFGGNEKPDIVNKCIESWKKYCPDWKIMEWNESNVDLSEYIYMKEAHEAKKWAFVSDVARLIVVHRVGGIYLDTDVELMGALDDLIKYDFFGVFESEFCVATGLGFGAKKGHLYVEEMLNYYKEKHFINDGKMDLQPCPANNTAALKNVCEELVRNGKTQVVAQGIVLSMNDYNHFAKHHGEGSWVDKTPYKKRVYKDWWIKRFLRQDKFFVFVEKKLGKKALKVYVFCVYDLLEMGPFYYLKRFVSKRLLNKK